MKRALVISTRIDEKILKRLGEIATAERRTMANLIRKLLIEAVMTRAVKK